MDIKCKYCRALLFKSDNLSMCCQAGQVPTILILYIHFFVVFSNVDFNYKLLHIFLYITYVNFS